MSGIVPSTESFFLFDGALLHASPEHAWLLEQEDTLHLYDDLGEQAIAVGPLLLPATPATGKIAQAMATSTEPMQFAISRLTGRLSTDRLDRHLRRLRYLETDNAQRYYFRYADGRAFEAVWRTLEPEQQAALLGPIISWEHIGRDGRLHKRVPPSLRQDQAPAPLPLRLQPRQWHLALEAGRIGELFDSTLHANARPAYQGDPEQWYAWTEQTYHWLRRLGIDKPPVRLAANRVMWQTAGLVYRHTQFEQALIDAQRSDDTSHLLDYGELRKR
ncbi:DUF4123 domain-containing protein [Zestomonas carbonaria]|uniref:DUF4123 domain-containing protein n=1 Tax=Zestomonas carbonaria TaxID=2762745 RepID=A0A7U7EPH8_9GAMM|nr:DUF4123 domain-containing protein [Pseudomonas carbonaria]CAD5108262.1 hypothetical protein PSEWESI4_02547 [Pseudomonas carbonaria]